MSSNDPHDGGFHDDEDDDLGDRATALPEPAPDEPLSDRKTGDTHAGRYKLEKMLGRGAFGEVWSAKDEKAFGRLVAIKFLHEEHVKNADIVARFYREGQATAALAHPNVVTLVEFGNEGGVPYLVSEFVKGRSLRSLLDELNEQHRQFPTETALALFRGVCRGVGAAHALDIVHRDLKPENVMVTGEGPDALVKVLDFGVARIINRGAVSTGNTVGRTQQGQVIGSLQYMSPEQITGDTKSLDHRADVFALGAILFEVLTAQQCFTGETFQTVIGAILTGKRDLVSQMRPELPPGIDGVLSKAFAIYPRDRYGSVAELLADAEKVLSQSGGKTQTHRPPPMVDSSVQTMWSPSKEPPSPFGAGVAPATPMTGAGAKSEPAPSPFGGAQAMPKNVFRPAAAPVADMGTGATMVADPALLASVRPANTAPAGAVTSAMPAEQSAVSGVGAKPAPSGGGNGAVIAAAVVILLGGGGAAAYLLRPVAPPVVISAPSAGGTSTAAPSASAGATAGASASASAAPSVSAAPSAVAAIPAEAWVTIAAPSAPVTLGRGATGRFGFERAAAVVFAGPAFQMQRTEVTWSMYERWAGADPARAVSAPSWLPSEAGARAALPVVSIAWEKARAFCQAQGGDLPTEEQWEYAARGASLRAEPWTAGSGDIAQLNAFRGVEARLNAAGSAAVDATPEGLRDMAANAQEWTVSRYRQDDGTSPGWTATLRAIRGLPLREAPPTGNAVPPPFLYRNSACTGAACSAGDREAAESVGFRCARPAP